MTHNLRPTLRAIGIAAGIVAFTGACGGDSIGGLKDLSTSLASVKFDYHAATLAIGQEAQFVASPRTGLGVAIPDGGSPTYSVADTSRAEIDQDGRIRAKGIVTNMYVIAKMRDEKQNLTFADTLRLTITQDSYPISTFTIAPLDSSTLTAGMFQSKTYSARYTASNNLPVPAQAVEYWTTTPQVATLNASNGSVVPKQNGTFKLYARINSYGIVKVDSTTIRVEYLDAKTVTITASGAFLSFSQGTAFIIRKGATVTWNNTLMEAIPVTFEDPSNIPGGNIEAFSNTTATRTFPTPGVYYYINPRPSSSANARVRITVMPDVL